MKRNLFPSIPAFLAALVTLLLFASSNAQSRNAQSRPLATDSLRTSQGTIRIIPKFHASLQLEYRGKVVVVDPVLFGTWTKKADLILITHSHGDHLDLPAIAKLLKKQTTVVAPTSVAPTIETIRSAKVVSVKPGAVMNYRLPLSKGNASSAKGLSVGIQAVPMYNLQRGPAPGKKYHPRDKQWTGYVLTIGGKRLYIAGDTEITPEMKALKNIDAAFLPMNLPYTMTPEEAAAGAKTFRPKVVYPYHFRSPFDKANDNVPRFTKALQGSRISVRVLDWYPTSGIERFRAAQRD